VLDIGCQSRFFKWVKFLTVDSRSQVFGVLIAHCDPPSEINPFPQSQERLGGQVLRSLMQKIVDTVARGGNGARERAVL